MNLFLKNRNRNTRLQNLINDRWNQLQISVTWRSSNTGRCFSKLTRPTNFASRGDLNVSESEDINGINSDRLIDRWLRNNDRVEASAKQVSEEHEEHRDCQQRDSIRSAETKEPISSQSEGWLDTGTSWFRGRLPRVYIKLKPRFQPAQPSLRCHNPIFRG